MNKWTGDALFSSKDQSWAPPAWLFDRLNADHHFDLDAAATEATTLCPSFIGPEQDALTMENWPGKRVWLNPPYGRQVGHFVAKAKEQAALGKLVVVLIFARTDTRWWHDHAMNAQDIYLVKGRLRFTKSGKEQGAAPAPSAILVFNGKTLPEACPRFHRLDQP